MLHYQLFLNTKKEVKNKKRNKNDMGYIKTSLQNVKWIPYYIKNYTKYEEIIHSNQVRHCQTEYKSKKTIFLYKTYALDSKTQIGENTRIVIDIL